MTALAAQADSARAPYRDGAAGHRLADAVAPSARLAARQLHHFFEQSADRTPDQVALVCGGEHLTYAELDRRANRLAHHLIASGVGPGSRVGLLVERSVEAYAALLAVLKCGAAFVPLDCSFPADRVAFIAEDAGFTVLLTTAKGGSATAEVCCPVIDLAAQRPDTPATRPGVRAVDDTLCYIIYTSGTTGRPKGVAISHRNAVCYLEACGPVYGVTSGDRVYQGITFAFDFAVEEVWIAFAAGATLVAGPNDHRRIGGGLNDFLIEQQVTVLGCVPTLLATLERDVPTLRTLLVGGEACPADLVRRWCRPGLRMLNTYGPTETTVTATWGEMASGRPVTIGRPLPTYTVHLLDEELKPVPEGSAGEICIGGPCVAVGYVNRPDLTAEKFIDDPFSDTPGARLYRSGDLGRFTKGGEIEFLGRMDSQVKVRGFRIELGEIEAVLREGPAVASALVGLIETDGGGKELAAYLTLREPSADEGLRTRLHATLRHRLPPYMVPAYVEVLDAIPTLPSGKADRARLPAPTSPRLVARNGDAALPETPLEHAISASWGKAFGHPVPSVEDDFFLDLGGHSLLAASAISELRRDPALHCLGIGDLYTHPTVRGLARHAEEHSARPPVPAVPPPARRHGTARVWACGVAQAVLAYLAFAVLSVPAALALLAERSSPAALAGAAAAALAVTMSLGLALPVAAKWLLVGRFRPGRYPLWGWYYCRWWLVRRLQGLAPVNYLAGSPLFALYLRLLGARVGRGCHLGSAALHLPDLLDIGDGASIGYGAVLEPFYVEGGWLIQAPVRIGAEAFVGANSVVLAGARIGADACLAEQSLLARDQAIPDGETWAGSPSARVAPDAKLAEVVVRTAPDRWSAPQLASFVLGVFFFEGLPALLLLPGLVILYAASLAGWCWPLLTPAAGLAYVLTTCAVVAAGKRLVMPSIRPGLMPLRSWFGLRKWLSDKFMVTSLAATNSLYATLYALPWLRLLGARVGPRAEVSTVSNIDPDLLVLGPESFVADSAAVGAARYHGGQVALGVTELGRRCFVGNASLVPADARLAPGSLLGVLSVPPAGPVEADTSWLGSPAIFLPRRQVSERFDEGVTYRPSPRLVACRLAIEFFRVTLPPTLMYALVVLCGAAEDGLATALPAGAVVALLPATYFGGALLVTGVVAALKWLVVGRYRPRVVPLWSHFVWRTELITALYESVAVPWLLRWCTGTPWLPALLRLFGARFGRRVYLETTSLTEFDLVRVGDDVAVGGLTLLQTHLFEDRVMKMSAVALGAGCTVGTRSVVLYDAEVGAGAELDALSLVMKGETLPPATRWRGIPARPEE
jgi:non-ribosomal peptide synthetase-like protein